MTTVNEIFPVGTPSVVVYPKEKVAVNPELVIGLELETENCTTQSEATYSAICKKTNFIIKTDGSLRGVAYEFISKPMATKHALASLGAFFTMTKFAEGNYTDRCSVHVHVNCTDLTMAQVSAVALLYTVVEDILFEFVGNSRDSNIYCIPWNQCRNHHALVAKFLGNAGDALRGWNKYTALNILPLSTLGTVEFRQMHGTADMEKLTTWINIIGGLFKYARENQLKDLTEQIKSLNTTSHYEAFFTQVLSGQLPYNDLYRQKLENGVILAKYSMITNKPAMRAVPLPAREAVVERGINLTANTLNVNDMYLPPLGGFGPGRAQTDEERRAVMDAIDRQTREVARIVRDRADAAVLTPRTPRPAPTRQTGQRRIPVPIDGTVQGWIDENHNEGEF